jgi:hypothetical protein
MKNKKIKIISFMLLMAMVIGIMPIGMMDKSYASKNGQEYEHLPKIKNIVADLDVYFAVTEDGRVLGGASNYYTYAEPGKVANNNLGKSYYTNDIKNVGINNVDKVITSRTKQHSSRAYVYDKGAYIEGTVFLLKNDGTILAAGTNFYGQLGVGNKQNTHNFLQVKVDNVKDVFSSPNSTFFLKENGEVWATGSNGGGQLGIGNETNKDVPTKVGIEGVKEVVVDSNSTFFLRENGEVWATGYNNHGELGVGNEGNKYVPTKVGIEGVKEVIVDSNSTFFLKGNGEVWATGYNNHGELGVGDREYKHVPTKVNIEGVKEVIVDSNSTFFLRENGEVWATGYNNYGQLGVGDREDKYVPTKTNLVNIEKVETINEEVVFYDKNNKVWMSDFFFSGNFNNNLFKRLEVENVEKVIIRNDVLDYSIHEEKTIYSSHYDYTKALLLIKKDGTVLGNISNGKDTQTIPQNSLKDITSPFYYGTDFVLSERDKNVNKYGSWSQSHFGVEMFSEDIVTFSSNVKAVVDEVMSRNNKKYFMPNNTMITIDEYGMMEYFKTPIENAVSLTIPFDGRRVTKVELGHIDGIGLVPLLYTNDGFIHYIDPSDNQVRMLPVFQNEIKGTMVYHEQSNKATHYLFIKNDGSLVYVDKNRLEQIVPINMNDVAQIISSTHARPDYFLMKDGTLKTLTGDVTLPDGLVVKNVLSNRFVELLDDKIYSIQGTSAKSTDVLSFMIQGATNDLLWLKNGQIMQLDLSGNASYLNDVNGKLVKSIVKVDENSTFILMLDDTTKSYGDIAGVGDLVNKGIDYTKVSGFISNNTGTNMLMMLVDMGELNCGYLYNGSGKFKDIAVTNTALDEIKEESDFTFDPQAQVEALIATIEEKIGAMTKIEETEEIQNLINKLPYSHQEDKNRLQQLLIDKIKELESGGVVKEAEEAVKKAEETKLQADIDKARELVNKLPEGEVKDNLITRLDKVQVEINNDEEYKKAQEAVEKAKETQLQEDIDKAKELVNKLPDGANKDSLIEQIKNLGKETIKLVGIPNITVVNGKKISVLLRDTQIEGTYNGITFTIEGDDTRYTGTPENVPNTWTKIETLDKGNIWIRSIPAPITEQQVVDFY